MCFFLCSFNNIAYVYFKVDYGKWKKTVEDMGYDLVDVFMDVDFYCTKSNGKQVRRKYLYLHT